MWHNFTKITSNNLKQKILRKNLCSEVNKQYYQKFFDVSNSLKEISNNLSKNIVFNAVYHQDFNPNNFKFLYESVDYSDKYDKIGKIFKKHQELKLLLNDKELKIFLEEYIQSQKNKLASEDNFINQDDYQTYCKLSEFYKNL